MTIDIVQDLSEADLRVIEQGLTQHAAGLGITSRDRQTLHVLARDHDGLIIGGLTGATVWGWLEVKLLWFPNTAGAGDTAHDCSALRKRRRGGGDAVTPLSTPSTFRLV